MTALKGKIDFVAIISAENANPNGDPLYGNRPRTDINGYGEISDVCIKRKIRNRFQDFGERVFVQNNERAENYCKSLEDMADSCYELKQEKKGKLGDNGKIIVNRRKCAAIACAEWIDVRTFGVLMAFSKKDKKKKSVEGEESETMNSDPISVRGPVSINIAVSSHPIEVIDQQITKCINADNSVEEGFKGRDTMGMKHRVPFGLYVLKGSVSGELANKTGFSQEDAEKLKEAIRTLFENDASSARPEGSMEVVKFYWWQHDCAMPKVPTARIFRSVKVVAKPEVERPASADDFEIYVDTDAIEGLKPEEIV